MAKKEVNGKDAIPGIRFLGDFIRLGGKLGLSPYGWDWSTTEMYYKPGRLHEIIHSIWFLVLSSYGAFMIRNSILLLEDEDATEFMKLRVAYMTGVYVALNIGFLLNMQTFGQHHDFVNQLMSFTAEVDREFGLQINGKVLKAVLGVSTFGYLFGCTNAIAVFFTQESKRLLTSLWDNPQDLPLYTKLLLVFIHLLLNAGQFYHVVHSSQVSITYVFLVYPAISRLRWLGMAPRASSSSSSARLSGVMTGTQLSPLTIHRLYQQILVLQAKYRSAYGGWVLLIVTWALYILIMSIFQAAVFRNIRAFVLGSCFAILMKYGFKTCADVYEISKDVIESWGDINNPAWFRRYRRAAQPARVPIGTVFYFDKGIMPTFMDIAFSTAADLILSYNQ